jgi:hypothetical protein
MNERIPFDQAPKYVISPGDGFPLRWEDHIGPLRVIGQASEGYIMVRRPGGAPFVLQVSQLLNARPDPVHGPFRPCVPTKHYASQPADQTRQGEGRDG